MTWNDGYVSEINYTHGFYGELSPGRLAWATLLKSVQPPDFNQNFTYCELACGQGYTTNILAATHPQGQFYATDFNPNHIATARDLAKKAGIRNIHFFEDSFQEFLHRELPDFDVICLHGIYSWISEENRRYIVEFIKKKLKVQGLLYISYNALPGWAAVMPLRELMLRHGQKTSDPILTRVEQAMGFIEDLFEANPAYLAQNPTLKARYESIKKHNRHYVAHEYFNEHWHPCYFDEVVRELDDAKVTFIGSSNPIDQLDFLNVSQPALEKLNKIQDPIYREVVRDYFVNTQFRRDIFGRGVIQLTPQEQNEYLQKIRFALMVPLSEIKLEHKFPVGELTLKEDIYKPITEVLAEKPLTLAQLQSHPKLSHHPLNVLFQAIHVMSGVGYLHPAVDDQTAKKLKKVTDNFNAAIQQKALYSSELNWLACPLTGTGINVNRINQLFLMAKAQNKELAEFAWGILSSQNQNVIKEGKVLQTPEENLVCLKELESDFVKGQLLTLQKLGIG